MHCNSSLQVVTKNCNTLHVSTLSVAARYHSALLQSVAVCCSVLQCVAVTTVRCCRAMQCVAVFCSVLQLPQCVVAERCSVLQCFAVCCSYHSALLQSVAVCCSVLQCFAVTTVRCCRALQCVAVFCSVLQCVVAASHGTAQKAKATCRENFLPGHDLVLSV